MASRQAYEREADKAANRWDVNPAILKALLQQESGFRMGVGSSAGARDIAQFMPATAKAYGVTLGDGRASDDINGAAHYLHDNLKRTHGDIKAALSIYNSGRPDAYKDPHFAKGQTYNYVRSILRLSKGFGGSGASTHGGGSEPRRSSARGRSAITVDIPTSEESTSFDQEAFDRAKKLSILGAYLKKKNPNNALLRAGVLSDQAPNPGDFTKTTTEVGSEKFTIPGTGSSTGGGGGGGTSSTADAMVQRADKLDSKHFKYVWGGNHGATNQLVPADCSGAVSYVTGVNPRVASQFKTWGSPGAGGDNANVRIYAKDSHVLMAIKKADGKFHFFGTSGSNPGGGAGWIEASAISPGYLAGFTVRHSSR